MENLKIKIYADGAVLEEMKSLKASFPITGFTTNPTLMAKAGIKDYLGFAKEMLQVTGDLPVSFEVFADDFDEMYRQALILNELGDTVYIKIPITNSIGESSNELIGRLNIAGIKLNITAIFTKEQISGLIPFLKSETPAIISIFAGRIADAGYYPEEIIKYAVDLYANKKHIEILWASCREILNVKQANDQGCHIITVPNNMLGKIKDFGKDLNLFSLETVQMFRNDALASGFTL